MRIDNKYNIGSKIYIVTDLEQKIGIITSILVGPKDLVYLVSRDSVIDRFYDFELSDEENKTLNL